MDKEKPLSLKIFGWSEIILGTFGTFILIMAVYGFIRAGGFQGGLGAAVALMWSSCCLPSMFLLFGGVGLIRLKPFGIKANFALVYFVSILTIIIMLLRPLNTLMVALVAILWTYPILLFFERQEIKELFKIKLTKTMNFVILIISLLLLTPFVQLLSKFIFKFRLRSVFDIIFLFICVILPLVFLISMIFRCIERLKNLKSTEEQKNV